MVWNVQARRVLAVAGMVVGVVAGVAAPAGAGQPDAAEPVVVIDYGVLGSGRWAEATAVNDRLVVAGYSYLGSFGSTRHAFKRGPNGLVDLGTLPGGDYSEAADINYWGDVVGRSTVDPQNTILHATLWQRGQVIDLGTLGGQSSYAFAINDHGQIVGTSQVPNGDNHAFRWQRGVMTDLGGISASGINERGDIVGTAVPFNNRPVLWRGGQMTTLPMPAGAVFGGAGDINERGQVLMGWYDGAHSHGGLVDGGTVTDLGVPPGRADFFAAHLNDRGDVTGSDLSNDPVIWRGGQFVRLPKPAPTFSARALDLDNHGHVVGSADTGPVEQHAVMWSVH